MCLKLSVGIGLVMNMLSAVKSLMRCFPYSFINCMGEFVAQKYADGYFKLDDCKTEEDVKYKVLAYLSLAVHVNLRRITLTRKTMNYTNSCSMV